MILPDFDFGLGETIDALRDSVATFCAREISPVAAEIDHSNEFPRELWPKLGALGGSAPAADASPCDPPSAAFLRLC